MPTLGTRGDMTILGTLHPSSLGTAAMGCWGVLLPDPNTALTAAFLSRLSLAIRAHGVQWPRGGGLHNVILVKDGGPGCGAATWHPHRFPRESSARSMAH